MEWWEYLGLALIAIVFIPVFLGGGFAIAIGLALIIAIVFWGFPRLFSYVESRHMGISSAKIRGDMEDTPADVGDPRWRRNN